jgi:hypothetical protein
MVTQKSASWENNPHIKIKQLIMERNRAGSASIKQMFCKPKPVGEQSQSPIIPIEEQDAVPYAIVLLKSDSITKGDLSEIKIDEGRSATKLTPKLELIIARLAVDGIVVSGGLPVKECDFFSRILPSYQDSPNYILPYNPEQDFATMEQEQPCPGGSSRVRRSPSSFNKLIYIMNMTNTKNEIDSYFGQLTRTRVKRSGVSNTNSNSKKKQQTDIRNTFQRIGSGAPSSQQQGGSGSGTPSLSQRLPQPQQTVPRAGGSQTPSTSGQRQPQQTGIGTGGSQTPSTSGQALPQQTGQGTAGQCPPDPITPPISPAQPPILPLPPPTEKIPASISRCAAGLEAFQPFDFKYTERTPNEANACDKGKQLIIDGQASAAYQNNIGMALTPPYSPSSCSLHPLGQIINQIDKAMNTYFSYPAKDTKYEYPRLLTHREMGLTGAYDMDEEFLRLSFLQIRAGSNRPTEDQLNAAEHQAKELREANYRRMLGILEEAPKHPHAPMKYLKDHKQELNKWLEYLPHKTTKAESAFRCSVCNKHHDAPYLNQVHKPELAKKEGVVYKNMDAMRDGIRNHQSSAWHRAITDVLETAKKQSLKKSMVTAIDKEYEKLTELEKSTYRMFLAAYVLTKITGSFTSHPQLVKLLQMNGVDMGSHHHGRKSAALFVRHISDSMQRSFLTHLVNSKKPFSIILDTATDSIGNEMLVILIQALEEDRPFVYFYKLIPVGIDTTAPGFLKLIEDSFKEDHLKYGVDMENHAKMNLVGITTDGAATFSGKLNGLGVILSKKYRGKPEAIFRTHCMAHRLNLAGRRIVDKIKEVEKFETDIKSIAKSFNAQNPKWVSYLTRYAKAKELPNLRITYAFTTRWATSEKLVLRNLRKMIPLLSETLDSISVDCTISAEGRAKAEGLKHVVTDRGFVLTTHFMSDVINLLSSFSLVLQTSGSLIVGKDEPIQNLKNSVKRLGTVDGAELTSVMMKLQCKKDALSNYRRCRNSKDVELSHSVRWLQPEHTDHLQLGELKRNPAAEFDAVRQKIVKVLSDELESYFPEQVTADFDVFHPKKFDIESAKTRTFGNNAITSLATRFDLDAPSTIKQWQDLWYELSSRPDFDEMKIKKPEHFWPALLRDPAVTIGENVRKLTRIVLVLPSTSADAERAFSHMNHIKSSRRLRMASSTVDALMRVVMNGPDDFYLFPSFKFAREWTSSGHWHAGDLRAKPFGRKRGQDSQWTPPNTLEPKRVFTIDEERVAAAEISQIELERDRAVEIAGEAENEQDVFFEVDQDQDRLDLEFLNNPGIFRG